MRWTPEQLQEYQQRNWRKKRTNLPSSERNQVDGIDCTSENQDAPESQLQAKIETWCKEHGYYCFHDRSRGVNTAGMLDLVIAFPGGKTFWLELKRPGGGRLSEQQKQTILRLQYLGHNVIVIRSFKQFLEAVNGIEY